MISFEPLILASEIVQHVILIVLVGIVLGEYMRTRMTRGNQAIYRIMLIAVILAAGWAILCYFFESAVTSLQQIVMYLLLLAPMLWLLWRVAARSQDKALRRIFRILASVIVIYFSICLAHCLSMLYLPEMAIVRKFLEVGGMMILYFFILNCCIQFRDNEKNS